jgi:hypothetical protein
MSRVLAPSGHGLWDASITKELSQARRCGGRKDKSRFAGLCRGVSMYTLLSVCVCSQVL